MTPVLFGAGAATYGTQGLGALADALTCEINEELNGEYELEMTYPVSGRRYSDLKNRCIIVAKPDPYRGEQPFRIYRITRPLNGVITVYARHISYDLSGIPVNPFTAGSAAAAMAGLKSNSAVSNPFTFWTNLGTTADFLVTVPSSIRSILGGSEGSILDTYGGEYEWDGFTVRLRSHRGQDNGVRIAYGKNLTDIEQDENIANLATGVIGYWAGSDGTLVQTGVVDAPGTYNFDRIITVDFSSDFEEQPTEEQLTARVQQYISDNNIGVPDVSISVSWVNLEQYSGYEGLSLLERVSLGDTVTVEFPPLGVEATARVVKTVYDVLSDRYVSADIGSVQANIADTIAGQQQQLQQVPNKTEIQKIAQSIAGAIMGAKGGSVRLLDTNGDGDPDTLYIADNPDPSQAVKVWRFNYEGWGASSNGYNGPFEMSAALGLGMYADFITTGTLNAALVNVINLIATNITSGTLQSKDGTTFYLDLDNGVLRMKATEFTVAGQTVQQIADASASVAQIAAQDYADAAARQAAQEAQAALDNYSETVTADLANLQGQIDGQIATFFYDYLPTTDNVPASEWTTDAEKQQHLGDLFYIVDNTEYGGQAYRWAQVNGAYQWILIEDTAVAQALEQAAQAQDTADSKRRVFVAQPVPPYDVGDLWSQGPDGSLMVCCNARSSGSYLASDWQSSADYINSQQASAIAGNAVAAQTQTDIFNKLTNNGQLQGLYMQNGQLYINASYMNTGTLSAVKIQSQDGSSSWDLAGGSAVFNNDSIQINSSNFQLDEQGNVNTTGTFHSTDGTSRVDIQDGLMRIWRKINNGTYREAATIASAGSNASIGNLYLLGPKSDGSGQTYNVTALSGYPGGSLNIYNAAGQVRFQVYINGNGDAEVWVNGQKKF